MHWIEPEGEPADSYLLDLSNDEARTWITDYVCNMIQESHIRIYRQDFNIISPMRAWSQHEAPDRVGAMENRHIQGYLQYWDDLLRRNPGLWIDSCAGGGRRNDLEAMRRAVPLHFSDIGYGEHPMKQRQHRQMFEWIPYFRAHTKNDDDDAGNYLTGGEQKVDAFSYHNALVPSVTSLIEYTDDEEMFALGRKMDGIWRRAAALELSGDYYPLTECNLDPWDYFAMQFDDPKSGKGFIQIIRNTQAQEDSFTVYPFAQEDAVYHLTDPEHGDTLTLSGADLKKGFTVQIPRRSGILWFYQKD